MTTILSGQPLDDALALLLPDVPGGKGNAFGIAIDQRGAKMGVRLFLDDLGTWQAKGYAGRDWDGTVLVGAILFHAW